jgi:hypothetical protein
MDIQNIVRASDLRDKHVVPNIEWQRGESIVYDVLIQEYGDTLDISDTATVKFQVWLASDTTTLYINKVGTLVDADNGEIRFELTTIESALAAGTYKSQVVIETSNRKAAFARCSLVVYANPLGAAISTVTSTFAADFVDLGDTPESYTGHANKIVTVNGDEDGLEFTSKSALGLNITDVAFGDINLNLSGDATPALVARKLHNFTITAEVTSITPTGLANGDLIWFFIINPSAYNVDTSGLTVFAGLSMADISEDGSWGVIGRREGVYYCGAKGA